MQTALISGLHCPACVKLITKKLAKLPSVRAVEPGQNPGEFHIDATGSIDTHSIINLFSDSTYSLVDLSQE
jgi:copper chaperone CopZ